VFIATEPIGRAADRPARSQEDIMKRWICTLSTIVTVAIAGLFGSPEGHAQYAYITNLNSGNVTVFDVHAFKQVGTIEIGNGTGPYGVAVSVDGSRVYVTNSSAGSVSVIDSSEMAVIATFKVGHWPHGVAITPDGSKVYVANWGSDTVSVITPSTGQVETISLPPSNAAATEPLGVAIDPLANEVYVTDNYSDQVSVIDTSHNQVFATIDVGTSPVGVAVAPDGMRVYVANGLAAPYLRLLLGLIPTLRRIL
jgi:YVTN family beta-propeller protein